MRALAFFNGLSGALHIGLSEPAQPISPALMNRKAPPAASITSVTLRASVFEDGGLRALTPEELDLVVLEEREVRDRGYGDVVCHVAPNGTCFRVRDLLAAIEETERQTRHQSEWFEGIDVHHTFFEGMERDPDAIWRVRWGS